MDVAAEKIKLLGENRITPMFRKELPTSLRPEGPQLEAEILCEKKVREHLKILNPPAMPAIHESPEPPPVTKPKPKLTLANKQTHAPLVPALSITPSILVQAAQADPMSSIRDSESSMSPVHPLRLPKAPLETAVRELGVTSTSASCRPPTEVPEHGTMMAPLNDTKPEIVTGVTLTTPRKLSLPSDTSRLATGSALSSKWPTRRESNLSRSSSSISFLSVRTRSSGIASSLQTPLSDMESECGPIPGQCTSEDTGRTSYTPDVSKLLYRMHVKEYALVYCALLIMRILCSSKLRVCLYNNQK